MLDSRFEVPIETSERQVEEGEVIVEIQKSYEELRQERWQRGYLEGRIEMLVLFFARRLGRSLTDAEHAVLAERLVRLGEDRLIEILFTRDGPAAAAWFADPAAR